MISIKSLRVDYEDVNAVSDLNVEIQTGQIYGLVGPNGAGKTSTIKAIAGIIEPTYGEIKIAGIDLELEHERALQQLGYMPDFSPVYENLKVWEYLDVFAAAYLISPHDRIKKIQHWVERVNLQEKWSTFIRDLSRGMRQRLVLAKTLLHEPEVLILDEPASGLDPIARKEMQDTLKVIAAENKTILISSHILSELSSYCNAIGIMERGRMVVSGTIDEIRERIGSKGRLRIVLSKDNPQIADRLTKFLSNSKFIQNLHQLDPGVFESNFSGEAVDATWLLSQLVKLDIPISNFYIREESVEDIFFKIGAREVS